MAADPARPPDDQGPPPHHPRPPRDNGEQTVPSAGLLGGLAALGPYFAVEVHPPGCQFDRERIAVELTADTRHDRGVGIGKLEIQEFEK